MPLNQRSYGRTSPAALLAYQTADQLRVALGTVGFEPDYDFPALHGDTTVSEEPFVTFGRCNIDVILRLIALLQSHPRSNAAPGDSGDHGDRGDQSVHRDQGAHRNYRLRQGPQGGYGNHGAAQGPQGEFGE